MRYLYVDDVVVSESQAFATVVLRLDAPAEGTFSVNYSTASGFATGSAFKDLTGVAGAVTFNLGETEKSVQIAITNDAIAEREENFWFTMTVPGASQPFVTLSRNEVPVTIVDNDSAQGGVPIASVGDLWVDEQATPIARFTITLDRPSGSTVMVEWQAVGGSAQSGSDFVAASGTAIFAAGNTAQTVEIALVDDSAPEGAEQFQLQLSNPSNATIGRGIATATIGANDAPLMPKPNLFVDDVTVSEDDTFAELVLRLDAPSASAITVNYATASGYATGSAFADVYGVAGVLTFAPGQTLHTVKVPITNADLTPESLEQLFFNLSLPAASVPLVTLARAEIPVAIVDNDSLLGGTPIVSVQGANVDESSSQFARFIVTLDRPALGVTRVDWQAVSGTAQEGTRFVAASGTVTFMPGDTAQAVEVALIDDAIAQGAQQFAVQLSAPQGLTIGDGRALATIGANDGPLSPKPVLRFEDVAVSEADGYAEVVLRLDAPSASAITVNYATASGYATGSAFADVYGVAGSLTFVPGQTVHTVKVPINTSNLDPEREEGFFFTLTVPAASSALVTLSRNEGIVTIVDNDSTQGGTPVVAVRDTAVDERGDDYAHFVVTLDRPASQIVTVDWETSSLSATAFDDFLGANGTLVFLPGDTAQTVDVALIDDALAEGSEQFRLVLTGATNATVGQSVGTATIGANDGANAPKPVLFVDDVTVSEADLYADVVLRLDAPSATPIAVNYTTASAFATGSAFADVYGVAGSLVFAPGETLHVVRVPINVNDLDPEGQEHFTFEPWLPAASQPLVTLARTHSNVSIVDNDSTQGGTPVAAVRDVIVDENTGQYARFVVVLDRPALGTVTVDWETVEATAREDQDYKPANGTLSFLAGDTAQTIEIAIVDDALAELAESFELHLVAASGATIGTAIATAVIAQNDLPTVPKPVLGVADVYVSESDPFAQMTLLLDKPSASPITVNFATQSGTATGSAFADVYGVTGSVTFAPGQTLALVDVAINTSNLTPEPDENFFLNLSLPAAGQPLVTLARTQVPVVIVDDDNGVPVLSLGLGDDSYRVDALTDRVVEGPGGGTDTIETALDNYPLPAFVENLTLLGLTAIRATGNALDNVLAGNGANNVIDGGQGWFDIADYFQATGPVTVDLVAGTATGGGGGDTLISIEGAYGSAFADLLRGSDAANILRGQGGNDDLRGFGGNDHLAGGAGNDSLDGGSGLDVASLDGVRSGFSVVRTSSTTASVTDNVGTEGVDTLVDVERLAFDDTYVALDIDGIGGQAYRLYQAAFARVPDTGGVGYWIAQLDAGAVMFDVASGFIESAEFASKYGQNPTNQEYTLALYTNVLNRAPDQAGYDYWNAVLNGDPLLGQTTRQQMLIDFAESGENKANVLAVIGNGFDYDAWLF